MARRRQSLPVAAGTVPTALTNRHDPLWNDPAAVADLAAAHGLRVTIRGGLDAAPGWARFDAFRAVWCQANGLMDPRWRILDYARARDAGIDTTGSSRYRIARVE